MKDKKRVLSILLLLIIFITVLLIIVLVFGGIKEKELNKYYNQIEDAACKLAKDDNYTESICEAFPYLCKIHTEKLITRKYLDDNIINPLTKKKASLDTKGYVEITWKDKKMQCKYKEG